MKRKIVDFTILIEEWIKIDFQDHIFKDEMQWILSHYIV